MTPASSSQPPVVALQDICKSFGQTQVLKRASLQLQAGQVHVLMGENGAGKSTLMKILCGQLQPDRGVVRLGQAPTQFCSPGHAARQGVVMVHQELQLIPALTVAENLFLGTELTSCGLVQTSRINAAALAHLESLGLAAKLQPSQRASELSTAQAQLLEIARALRHKPQVLVMDEPTSSLGNEETQLLFTLIKQLRSAGTAIVYISHRMEEVFAIGDHVTVLRDGSSVFSSALDQNLTVDTPVQHMIGRPVAEHVPKRTVAIGKVALRVRRLGGSNFIIRQGEIFGLAGLIGSGRSRVARALFGTQTDPQAEILLGGKTVVIKQPQDAIKAGIILVPEDRKQQGLILGRSVLENLGLTMLQRHTHAGIISPKKEQPKADRLVRSLGIRTPSIHTPVAHLSGGNQQKVVLGKWLDSGCQVLILDEPTRGIDVGAKADLYKRIGELAQSGVAILLISSDLPELLGLSDRIGVMHDGTLQGVLPAKQATPQAVMTLAIGQQA